MIGQQLGRPVEVLLVEDNPADVRLFHVAFRDCPVDYRISVARDGLETLAFLARRKPFSEAPRPDLILLDLNLPPMGGAEILRHIRSEPLLRPIPVLVFTTSSADADIIRTYEQHANCFITKPLDLDDFCALVRSIQVFWFQHVQLPSSP